MRLLFELVLFLCHPLIELVVRVYEFWQGARDWRDGAPPEQAKRPKS